MAEITTKKYVSLDRLAKYDGKIKEYIGTKDDAVLAAAQAYANGLASNYEPAGAIATAKTELEGKISTAQAAAEAADAKAVAAQADVDALETLVGTIPTEATATDVVGYIVERTSGIATDAALAELTGKVTQAEKDINAIEADYLKAADKTELAQAVADEAQTARAAEKANADAIKVIQDDYLKAADKAELAGDIEDAQKAAEAAQADIDAFMKATEVGDEVVDTLKEIQTYIESDLAAADKMTKDIGANADAIEALSGRMDTAEDDIDAVEDRMDTAEQDIADLQALFGEGDGTVADMIADAVLVEKQAREQAIAGVQEDADKGIEDAAAALAAAQAADDKAVSLNTAMDTRVTALEAIDHEHSNKELLDSYTQTEADLADAVAKKHAHANAGVLDGITAVKVAAWDAAEANAKAHADTEVAKDRARLDAVEAWQTNFVEVSEAEINALFPTA